MSISIIESSSCTSETNTTRNQLYSNRKEQENYSLKKKKKCAAGRTAASLWPFSVTTP